MSSSLLSDPSIVKLFARLRRPLTANCPLVPTLEPIPGPTLWLSVCGGGRTPGKRNASDSIVRIPANGREVIVRESTSPSRTPLDVLIKRFLGGSLVTTRV